MSKFCTLRAPTCGNRLNIEWATTKFQATCPRGGPHNGPPSKGVYFCNTNPIHLIRSDNTGSDHFGQISQTAKDTPAASKGSLRIPQLDGLRGAAILLVIIWHYFSFSLLPQAGSLSAYIMDIVRLSSSMGSTFSLSFPDF